MGGGIGRMEMRIEGRDEDIGNGSKKNRDGDEGKEGGGIETGKVMVAERMAMKRLTDDDEERG